jgi:hypothetical protein
VLPDPRRAPISAEAWAHQQTLLANVWRDVNEVHKAANATRLLSTQIEQVVERNKDHLGIEAIKASADKLLAELAAWEIHEPQAELPDGVQDYVSVPNRLLSTQYLYLKMAADQDPPLTRGSEERYAEINKQWASIKADLNRILDSDLSNLNQLMRETGIEEVKVP